MDVTEERTVVQQVKIGTKCDSCGTLFLEKDVKLHSFNWHHHSWGNDSSESYEWVEVCSARCFVKQLKQGLERLSGYQRTGKINDMPYALVKELVDLIKIEE